MEEQKFSLEDLVYIDVHCTSCGEKGQSPTFRQILEKPGSYLAKVLKEQGSVPVECGKCHSDKKEEE
jgi:hypothetical protein